MYAIVDIAGQQFKVEKESKLYVHRQEAEEGSQLEFDKVLLVDNDGKVKIGKLNADENTMAHQLGVSGIPTILFMREGKEVDRIVGAVPKQMLVEKIESHIAGQAQA